MVNSLKTVKETAELLHVSQSTVYRLAERGELPHIKKRFGLRFMASDIMEWLERDRQKSTYSASFAQNCLTKSQSIGINSSRGSCVANSRSKTRYDLGYGHIYQRKTKSGKIRWYIEYHDAQGKRVQKVAPLAITKEDAFLALQEEVRRAFNGLYGVRDDQPNTSFKEFVDSFIENYSKTNKRSWKDDKCRLSRLAAFYGEILLKDLSALDIEKFKSASVSQGLSKSTVNRYLAILKRMYNVAIAWGKAKDNPMKQVKLYPENDNLKERILSLDEEAQLLASSPEHLIPALIVALNTGMRRGEILGLTWDQVDLQAKEIRVIRTKSGRPRVVDINSRLFETLSGLKEKDGTGRYLFLNPKTGKPYGKLRRSFENACRKAKIKNLRFHDLRHTFASRLVERGADIIRVKELLGHSTVRVTERYLHSNRQERKRAVELLCQTPPDSGKKPTNLLHICDMEKEEKPTSRLFPLFSVN